MVPGQVKAGAGPHSRLTRFANSLTIQAIVSPEHGLSPEEEKGSRSVYGFIPVRV